MRIAVTRPEEDAGALIAKLAALGHEAVPVPLLTIRPRADVTIPDLAWQAIAVTSANGIRALPGAEKLRSVPMLTVGPQSLAAARQAGFAATAHGGDVNGLAAHIRGTLDPTRGPILYLSGAETTGDLAGQLTQAGFTCHRTIAYDAVPPDTLGQAADDLEQGRLDAVLLYSPRSARIWLSLAEKARLMEQAARLRYFCLSRNVAAVLPEGFTAIVAERPDEAAMMALLEQDTGTR